MRRLHVVAIALAAAAIGAGVALATAPSGIRTVDYSAPGTYSGQVFAFGSGIGLLSFSPSTDFVTQTITYGPHASSGWHSHVGIVLVTVKDGEVTRYLSDCLGQTFHTGDVFIETGDMGSLVLRNESAAPAHLAATFVAPPPVPANLRIDQPNPGCAVG
jgi:quercetin dioxygenase-like cupin family protein